MLNVPSLLPQRASKEVVVLSDDLDAIVTDSETDDKPPKVKQENVPAKRMPKAPPKSSRQDKNPPKTRKRKA